MIFATRNNNKMREIKKIIPEVVSMEDEGLFLETAEDGTTYEENAYKKAKAVVDATGRPALADDSGVEIAFFDNQPGLHSASFLYENSQSKKRNQLILEKMKDATDRRVTYVCTIALVLPTGEKYFTRGQLTGQIATAPKGEHGFAYDEIMIPDGFDKTLAEMTLEEKNQISHRNIALQKMQQVIEGL